MEDKAIKTICYVLPWAWRPAAAGIAVGAMVAIAGIGAALAQENYPVKPVRFVVSSSPGGGTDTTARLLAPKFSEFLGQQLVIENRPGAASMIGSEYVARSAPDGYTILIAPSPVVIVQATHRKVRFDTIRDFAPISKVVVVPQVLVGHPSVPAKTMKELIALGRSRPGQIDYAGGGYGSHGHMSMLLLELLTGAKFTYVPYKSGNAGLVDTMSGQVSLMMGNALSVIQHVRAAKLRAYGVTSAKRSPAFSDIPAIAESGVPGYESSQWFGVFAPAGTPREIVTRLHRDLTRAIRDPEVARRFAADGGDAEPSASPEEFHAFLKADLAKWVKVVRDAKIERQ